MRRGDLVRGLFGLSLLVMPAVVERRLPHRHVDRAVRVFSRALGARQLAEVAWIERRGSAQRLAAGAAVDGAHALTALAIAAWSPAHRRLALLNAATAAGFALEAALAARRAR